METNQDNFFNFSFKDITTNEPFFLNSFKGKVVLIVNTASKCGYTKQYDGLEKLYRKYNNQGFVIIGVPSNDFKSQEPGTNQEIKNFCEINYQITFPLTTKEVVKGNNAHPFYLWAREKLGVVSAPKWNFHKYLVDRNGNLVDYFISSTKPENIKLDTKIQDLLKTEL